MGSNKGCVDSGWARKLRLRQATATTRQPWDSSGRCDKREPDGAVICLTSLPDRVGRVGWGASRPRFALGKW